MAGPSAAPKCDYSTAYDRMMAEIQLDSDDDEPQVHHAAERAIHLNRAIAVKSVHTDQFKRQSSLAKTPSGSPVVIDDLRLFLTTAPKIVATAIRCIVERDRQGLNMLHPVFRLYLEDAKQLLLCAQKRSKSKTSNYLLSMDSNPRDCRSALTLGKLRGNWSGSEYIVYDSGLSPSKTVLEASIRSIRAIIEFAYDEMGPGRMNIRVPRAHGSGAAASVWRDPGLKKGGAAARKALGDNAAQTCHYLRNKRPQFDATTGGHVLDFQGRVTMPSIKNFQVQSDDHGDDTVLQFGRISCPPQGPRAQCKCHKNTFVLDIKHPLSPLQAFAVCLSTLDSKFADLKLFDHMTSLAKRK